MVFPLATMVFQWFSMVANHWSNNGMVTVHCYGLVSPLVHFRWVKSVKNTML